MNAKDFLERFTDSVYKTPNVLDIYWGYDYGEFTCFIVDIIDRIIKSEYKLSHEYFRIDASGWLSSSSDIVDEAKELDLIPHKWDLKVAVEHENNRHDWTDEVIKLMHIRCPLKVVIGYTDSEHRDEFSRASDTNKVSAVMDWMNSIAASKQIPDDEEFLIILGNAKVRPNTNKPDESIDYRGYLICKNPTNGRLESTQCWRR